MNAIGQEQGPTFRSLERSLARVYRYGTWLASAIIAIGMAVEAFAPDRDGLALVTAGVLLVALLPVVRLGMMAHRFIAERDRRYTAITVAVLVLVMLGLVIGYVFEPIA